MVTSACSITGKGRDPHKKPVLFLAHYDVVPAEEEGGRGLAGRTFQRS